MFTRALPTRCLFPRLAALVVLCLSVGAATAARLPVEFSIKRWTATERLLLSSVEAMVQTRDGFIWCAMSGGLGRFDGQNLRVHDAANTPELPVPVITALAEAPDGSLWIGSAGGGLVRWKAGRFHRYGPADGLHNERVKSSAWARTAGSGSAPTGVACLSGSRLAGSVTSGPRRGSKTFSFWASKWMSPAN